MPAVLMYIPSAAPRSTTFVSPVTIRTPDSAAAAAMLASTVRSVAIANPSSSTRAHVR